ncbi:hypothetical protein HY546_00150 [archaeon]|nr:hypothetical protein [archaeon]
MKQNYDPDFEEFDKAVEWFGSNSALIRERYPKQFVAVKHESIVGHAADLTVLLNDLRRKNIDPAFTLVRFVPERGVTVIF